VIEGAVTTIGLLGLGDAALPRRAQALEALYGLQREKSPELHFSVGMALARHGMKADARYAARTRNSCGHVFLIEKRTIIGEILYCETCCLLEIAVVEQKTYRV
jgi:hypothetical protein